MTINLSPRTRGLFEPENNARLTKLYSRFIRIWFITLLQVDICVIFLVFLLVLFQTYFKNEFLRQIKSEDIEALDSTSLGVWYKCEVVTFTSWPSTYDRNVGKEEIRCVAALEKRKRGPEPQVIFKTCD